MNSFKPSNVAEWRKKVIKGWAMEEALRKARAKAERDIFKQKVQANLIMGVALIVILCLLNWG